MRKLANKIKNILHKRRSKSFKFKTVVVENIDDLELQEKTLYLEKRGRKDKWLHFRCPCGCRETIDVNLMRSHKPFWTVKKNLFGEVTLYPSINKKDGCKSHFFIIKSKVVWAANYQFIPRNLS